MTKEEYRQEFRNYLDSLCDEGALILAKSHIGKFSYLDAFLFEVKVTANHI